MKNTPTMRGAGRAGPGNSLGTWAGRGGLFRVSIQRARARVPYSWLSGVYVNELTQGVSTVSHTQGPRRHAPPGPRPALHCTAGVRPRQGAKARVARPGQPRPAQPSHGLWGSSVYRATLGFSMGHLYREINIFPPPPQLPPTTPRGAGRRGDSSSWRVQGNRRPVPPAAPRSKRSALAQRAHAARCDPRSPAPPRHRAEGGAADGGT